MRVETAAAETVRLYAPDWARFSEYCAASGARALPAAPATVASLLAVRRRCDGAVRQRRQDCRVQPVTSRIIIRPPPPSASTLSLAV